MGKTLTNTKTILIAEDEKAYCYALVLKLKNAGFDAEGVGNGKEALEALDKKNRDLLILDLVMPEMSGFEVLEEMKKKNIKIPVLILSNLAQSEDKQKVIAFGVKDFIEKADTSISDVVKIIEKMLQ